MSTKATSASALGTLSAEELVELNFQRIATLVANLSLGVPIEEEHRRIVMVNQQFLDLFGIPA